jgi:hypothetical protein
MRRERVIDLVGRNVRVAVALAVALCSGCFEEKTTVTVYPNGSGTVHLSRKFTQEFTKENYAQKTEAEMQASAQSSFYTSLAGCEGIVAWANATGKVEGGCLIQDALGYFEDANKVKVTDVMGSAPKAPNFTWKKNPDGGISLTWAALETEDSVGKTFEKPRPTVEERAQEKKAAEAYKGLSLVRTAVLPGKITKAGGPFKDRSASVTVTLDDINSLSAFTEDCWDKIEKKATTKEAATAAVTERYAKLTLGMDLTCGPPVDPAEASSFEKELAKAKATYAGSELEKKIKPAQPAK